MKVKHQLVCEAGTWNYAKYSKKALSQAVFPGKNEFVPVNLDFDETNAVGKANNFKVTEGKVYCDIELFENSQGNALDIAPKRKGFSCGWKVENVKQSKNKKYIIAEGFTIMNVSFVKKPINKKCMLKAVK